MRMAMRAGVAIAGALAVMSPAWAQQNPAIEKPGELSSGANSFSEGQARDLLTSHGFSDVSKLVNDSQGIWRGTAMNGTQHVHVSVDFKGNISAQPE